MQDLPLLSTKIGENARGMLIALEGVDGTGKSTQAQLLKRYLEEAGLNVFVLKEPGGTPFGQQLRQLIMANLDNIDPVTQALLMIASRRQTLYEQISPLVDDGYVVICDRYIDSTYAYQGYGYGEDLEVLKALNVHSGVDIPADFTIYYDISDELRETRLGDRQLQGLGAEGFDDAGRDFVDRVRKGYRELAQQHPDSSVWLDISELSINEVARASLEAVEAFLNREIDELVSGMVNSTDHSATTTTQPE